MVKKTWSGKDLINKWQRRLSRDVSESLPWEVLDALCDGISSDTRLPIDTLRECIRTRDVGGLFRIGASLDVTSYTSADLLLQDRLIVDLFSKFSFPNSPFNKRERAQLRFFEAEQRCAEANFRVGRALELTTDVNAVIHRAIRHVREILGRFDLDEMSESSRFGPGSTLCVKGDKTTRYFKYRCVSPSVSSDAFPYAEALLAYDHQWNAYLSEVHPFDVVGPFSPVSGEGVELSITDFNKATFVPKNAKTDRSIAIEPYFNVFFQLGVGSMIRRRLRRCGIDLDSQLRNQALAREGSLHGRLATIDFSMASDTIALETVRLLLPPSWFEHLDRLRSKSFSMNGRLSRYEKFSSMGNGFTFELETLIFYAVALSSCEESMLASDDVSVYGDDVILPTDAVNLFTKVCSYLGFLVNEEKSFWTGSFRESCGEDFLGGVRARPVFCKELDTIQHVASLANRLLELDRSVGYGSRLNAMCSLAVAALHFRIPRDVRQHLVGPPTENVDGYIHSTCSRTLAGSGLVRWNRYVQCWEHPIIRFCATKFTRRDDAMALYVLRDLRPSQGEGLIQTSNRRITRWLDLAESFRRHIDGNVAREVTARKNGRFILGTGLVWSLGGTV